VACFGLVAAPENLDGECSLAQQPHTALAVRYGRARHARQEPIRYRISDTAHPWHPIAVGPVADHEVAFRSEKRGDGGGGMLAVRIEREDRVGTCCGSGNSRGERMALSEIRRQADHLDVRPRRRELGQTRGVLGRHAVIDDHDSGDVSPERVKKLVRGRLAVTRDHGHGDALPREAHVPE
jgi:hypothetical protein